MGVQLRDIVSRKEIGMTDLSGRHIAVDAMNTLYQFLSIIRQQDGTPLMDSNGQITSHLSGILYRNAKLVEAGITPVYVFDGTPPLLKKETIESRKQVRAEAETKWKAAVSEGDLVAARKYAQAAVRIEDKMISDSKKLLEAMGLGWVQAPSEGEAQAAFMCSKGDVYAAASQDFDALLFGTLRLVRNLNITGKRKLPGKDVYASIVPEIIELKDVLSNLRITQEQLVVIGILVGTDFNPLGVKGIGPKKALALVKEGCTVDNMAGRVKWEFDVSPREIFDIFVKPEVEKNYKIQRGELDAEAVSKILVDEHDFSEERIRHALQGMLEFKKKGAQKNLSSFF